MSNDTKDADQKIIDAMIRDCINEETKKFIEENRDVIVARARDLVRKRMRALSELPGA